MNRLIIVGAGGHGKVIADCASKSGYTEIAFVDDSATGEVMGLSIIGTGDEIEKLNDGKTDFVIGIGNNAVRQQIAQKHQVNWVTLRHPSAQISDHAKLGKGTVVLANAVVNACATVGEHAIINTAAIVEHDNTIGDYVHLSPRVALGGSVSIGKLTHVGIGAVVKNNIDIASDCTIGAGAVVVKSITEQGVYVGVPAKKLK